MDLFVLVLLETKRAGNKGPEQGSHIYIYTKFLTLLYSTYQNWGSESLIYILYIYIYMFPVNSQPIAQPENENENGT